MKKLYVVGQSTCYGMDLRAGKSDLSQKEYRQKYSFGGLLAEEFKYQLINSSYPMSSLSTVTKRIIDEYDLIQPDLLIVGVPQSTVREIYDPVKGIFVNILQKEYYFPKTVLIPSIDGVPKEYDTDTQRNAYLNYRKNITTEEAVRVFENEVLFLQNFLEEKNANYLFMQMAPIIPNKIVDGYTDEENDIKDFYKYFTKAKEINTNRWIKFGAFNAVDNLKHCKKGRTGHILEDGHLILKETIHDTIINSSIRI